MFGDQGRSVTWVGVYGYLGELGGLVFVGERESTRERTKEGGVSVRGGRLRFDREEPRRCGKNTRIQTVLS